MIEFLRTLSQYRGIIFFRTIASLRADARGMYLGYVWWFLEPVLNTALYYVIFGLLLGTKTSDYIAYLLIGTTIYGWFQTSIVSTMGTITGRAHLYRQIPLPKYLFAMVGIFSNTWRFVCVFTVVLLYLSLVAGIGLSWSIIWIPLLVLIQLFLICGFAINLSLASAYVRDMQTFTSVIFRAVLFLSAIFWDVSMVPEHLETAFYANPAASLIQCFRTVILTGAAPNLWHLMYLTMLALVLLQIGMLWHRRVDGHILKHIQT